MRTRGVGLEAKLRPRQHDTGHDKDLARKIQQIISNIKYMQTASALARALAVCMYSDITHAHPRDINP